MALRNAAATITGRCGGIGTSIARRLASRGQPVVLYDLSEEHGRTAVQNIEAAGGQALFLKRDVGSESDWKYIIQASIEAFEGVRTLVHNAGISGPGNLASGTLEQWNKVISINQTSIFLGCKYAEAVVAESAKGGEATSCVIIRISVTWAPFGIRLNSVSPGFVDTPLIKGIPDLTPVLLATPLRRLGTPAEVANAVSWLASEEAAYVTGTNLYADGGFSVSKLILFSGHLVIHPGPFRGQNNVDFFPKVASA